MSNFNTEWLNSDSVVETLVNQGYKVNDMSVRTECKIDIKSEDDKRVRGYLKDLGITCGIPENYGSPSYIEVKPDNEVEAKHEYQRISRIDLEAYERYLEYMKRLKNTSEEDIENDEKIGRVFRLRLKIIKFLYDEEKAGKLTGLYTLDELDKKGILSTIIELAELDSQYSKLVSNYSIGELLDIVGHLKKYKNDPITHENIIIKMRLNEEDNIKKIWEQLNQEGLYSIGVKNTKLNYLYSNVRYLELENKIKNEVTKTIKVYKENPDRTEDNGLPPMIIDQDALDAINKIVTMDLGDFLYLVNDESIFDENNFKEDIKEMTGEFLPNYEKEYKLKEDLIINKITRIKDYVDESKVEEILKTEILNKDNLDLFFGVKSVVVDETVKLEDLMKYTTVCSALMFKLVDLYINKKKVISYEDKEIHKELNLGPNQITRMKDIFKELSDKYLNKLKYNELTSKETRDLLFESTEEEIQEIYSLSTVNLDTTVSPDKIFPDVEITDDVVESYTSIGKSLAVGIANYFNPNRKAIKYLKDVLGITKNHVMSMHSDVLINVFELLKNSKYRNNITENSKFSSTLKKYDESFKFNEWFKDLLYPTNDSKYSKVNNTVRAFAKDLVKHLDPVVTAALDSKTKEEFETTVVKKYNDMGVPINEKFEPGFESKVIRYAMNTNTAKSLSNELANPYVKKTLAVTGNVANISLHYLKNKAEMQALEEQGELPSKENILTVYGYSKEDINLGKEELTKRYRKEATELVNKANGLSIESKEQFINNYTNKKIQEQNDVRELYEAATEAKEPLGYIITGKSKTNDLSDSVHKSEFTSLKPIKLKKDNSGLSFGDATSINREQAKKIITDMRELQNNNKFTIPDKQYEAYKRFAKERKRELEIRNRRLLIEGSKSTLAEILGTSKSNYNIFDEFANRRVTSNIFNNIADAVNRAPKGKGFSKFMNDINELKKIKDKYKDKAKRYVQIARNKIKDVRAFADDINQGINDTVDMFNRQLNDLQNTVGKIADNVASAVNAVGNIVGIFNTDASLKVKAFGGGLSSMSNTFLGKDKNEVTFMTPHIACDIAHITLNDKKYTDGIQVVDYYEEMDYVAGDRAIRTMKIIMHEAMYMKDKLYELPTKGFPIEVIREFSFTPLDSTAYDNFTPDNTDVRKYSIMDRVREVYVGVVKSYPMLDVNLEKEIKENNDKVHKSNDPIKTVAMEIEIIPSVAATKFSPKEYKYPLVSYVNLEMSKADVAALATSDPDKYNEITKPTIQVPVTPSLVEKLKKDGIKGINSKDVIKALYTGAKAGLDLYKAGKNVYDEAKGFIDRAKRNVEDFDDKVVKKLDNSFKKYLPNIYDYIYGKKPDDDQELYVNDEYLCTNIIDLKDKLNTPATNLINGITLGSIYSIPKDKNNELISSKLTKVKIRVKDPLSELRRG